MKPFFLTTSLLVLFAILTPQADCTPSNHNGRQLRTRTANGIRNRGVRRISHPTPRPSLPLASMEDAPGADSKAPAVDTSPEAHPERYREFLAHLAIQQQENSSDCCKAFSLVLVATGDEFAVESWMRKAAEDGNAVGMHYLGMTSAAQNAAPEIRYLPPAQRQALLDERRNDAREAAQWLKKAADMGYIPAMLDYSMFLRTGIGVERDEQAANRLMLNASRSGNFETRFSWLLQNNRLNRWEDKDRPEVAGEINRGNHHVTYYLSRYAPNSQEQLNWLQKASDAGNPAARYALASITSTQNPEQSLSLLKSAVALHDPAATFAYGSFLVSPPGEFHQRTGLQQNIPLGVGMIRLAALLGNSHARRALSRAYYRGELGFPRDHDKAYRHLRWINCSTKDQIAFAAQGFMLLTGDGVQQDIETGLRYIALAELSGYSYARTMLAYAHYKGLGTEKNVTTAIEYLQESAALGFSHAYVYIAFLAAKGLHGKPADPREAERYLNLAKFSLGDSAREYYDVLMQQDDWILPPFPLEKQ
ncbi:MAG: sel1 repeat family protein [Akkermansia sp.]|nr:sel1 repeat family protein [Akkermansia sp.]